MRGARRSLVAPLWELLGPVIDRDLKALSPFPSAAAVLLWQRGIRSYEDALAFLEPEFSRRSDPRALSDMQKAVARLGAARVNRERVGIFGDFDHDGISGVAILSKYVEDLGMEVRTAIPDGFSEGHAFRAKHREYFAKEGVTLMFTIDVGITNGDEIALAQKQGMDVVVLDHHVLSQGLPPAFATVDPKREAQPALLQYLCGAGVAFAFIDASIRDGLVPEKVNDSEQYLTRFLDRVALATIGDMVPMLGDNRILVAKGLEVIRNEPSVGVAALIDACGAQQAGFTEEDVTYCLVPRVNAASRMDHANTALAVLSASHPDAAAVHVKQLEASNRKRQKIGEDIYLEATSMVERDEIPWVVIVGKAGWPQGVIGVIASRLGERYHRPLFVYGVMHGVVRASARSIAGFDLIAAMQACGGKDLFLEFGGHAQAAGFSLREDWLPVFRERMLTYAKAHLTPQMITPVLDIHLEISGNELSPEFSTFVQKLAPFGIGNPRPRFLLRHATVNDIRTIGKNGVWREVVLASEKGGQNLRAMIDKTQASTLRQGDAIDVVFEFSGRGFYGRVIALRKEDRP